MVLQEYLIIFRSRNHHNLQKKCIKTFLKKILYAKLTYYDYSNKNVKHPDLKITKIWVKQK